MRKHSKKILSLALVLVLLVSLCSSAFAYQQVQNGSQGNDVKTMQKMLNAVMNSGLTVDGICGAKSVAAIKNFQKAYGLTADGICGKQTWAKLEAEYNRINTPAKCTSHTKGSYLWYGNSHPHYNYYKCAKCGAQFTDGSTTKVNSCTTCNPPKPSTPSYKTVQSGSQGSDVKTMQTMLNAVMNAGLTVDGICGAKSVDAIKKFQKACGLSADGICGKQTWEKLKGMYDRGEKIPVKCTSHKKGSFSHTETAHPHKQYYKCADCGTAFADGSTKKEDSCTTCNPPSTPSYKTVQNGSQGDHVKTMQTMLNAVMNVGLTVDGICGAKSVAAIKTFQKATKLTETGVCDSKTWERLKKAYDRGEIIPLEGSSIKIGSGKYTPGTLNEGSTYSISGKITSTYRLTNVTVGIYNADGSKTNSVKTVSPNTTTYDIKNVDSYIKFGQLKGSPKGTTYLFKVTAKDSKNAEKILVEHSFKVKTYQVILSSYKDVATFQKKVLSTWKAPVKATFLKIPGTGRAFGASRDGGKRKHAGIDYVSGAGVPVYAMQSGTVVEYVPNFYNNTSAVAIQHEDGSVARYCEISTSLRGGETVKQGQKIAEMKANSKDGYAMLHLELYLGTVNGSLWGNGANKYLYTAGAFNRRSDLIDPEFLLGLTN